MPRICYMIFIIKSRVGSLTFRTGESSLLYVILTSLKVSLPLEGHMGEGGYFATMDFSLGRFIYWIILSTDIINDIVSASRNKQ